MISKKGTPSYKLIPEFMIDSAVRKTVATIRVRDVLIRVAPKCTDMLIEHYHEAEVNIRDYVPGSPEHQDAKRKAVAARKSVHEYVDAVNSWAEMLAEKENESTEGKCLN